MTDWSVQWLVHGAVVKAGLKGSSHQFSYESAAVSGARRLSLIAGSYFIILVPSSVLGIGKTGLNQIRQSVKASSREI